MLPAALTAFLAPLLPVLIKKGEEAVTTIASEVGAAVAEHAVALWRRLRPKVEETPEAERAAERVAEAPGDERCRAALELELEALLQTDAVLAADVAALWEQARAAGVVAAAERGVAVGGSVTGSTIITGDDANVGR